MRIGKYQRFLFVFMPVATHIGSASLMFLSTSYKYVGTPVLACIYLSRFSGVLSR
jgi:hypothetical protein